MNSKLSYQNQKLREDYDSLKKEYDYITSGASDDEDNWEFQDDILFKGVWNIMELEMKRDDIIEKIFNNPEYEKKNILLYNDDKLVFNIDIELVKRQGLKIVRVNDSEYFAIDTLTDLYGGIMFTFNKLYIMNLFGEDTIIKVVDTDE